MIHRYIMYVYFTHARFEHRYTYDACPTFARTNTVCITWVTTAYSDTICHSVNFMNIHICLKNRRSR